MKLIDSIELVSTVRPTWKGGGHTFKAPHNINREHALRLLGKDRNVSTIKKKDLAQMRCALQQESGKKGKRTPGGINRIMSFINCTLSELVELDVIESAPRLKPLPEQNTKEEYYTRDQVNGMMEVAVTIFDKPALADAIFFAAFTGCRQDELLSLETTDLLLDRCQIKFRNTKNGQDHTLDIHRELYPILERRVAQAKPGQKVFHEFNNDDDLRNQFYQVRDYLGISESHNWHTFRHSMGTWLAERGVPLQSIAKVLNHRSPMTSLRYIKVTDKARKDAIDCL